VTAGAYQAFSVQPIAWEIADASTHAVLGIVARENWGRPERIEFTVSDGNRVPLGDLRQCSRANSLVRRLVSMRFGATFTLSVLDKPVATFRKRFNPFQFKMDIEFAPGTKGRIDRRLVLGAAFLVGVTEGAQLL
jgi:hypothetical protein